MNKPVKPGTRVRITRRTNVHYGRIGTVLSTWSMVSAAGLTRIKHTIQLPHNRTKSKTFEMAMEYDDFEVLDD